MKYPHWLDDGSHGKTLRWLMCSVVGAIGGIEVFEWLITDAESPLTYVGRYLAGVLGSVAATIASVYYVKRDRASRERESMRDGGKT